MYASLVRSNLVSSVVSQCRRALHSMSLRPGLTVASVAMLALAVGLSAATFSLVDAIHLRPVPFENSDRLAYVRIPGLSKTPGLLEVLGTSPVIEAIGAAQTDTALVQTDSGYHSARTATVTRGMSELFGRLRGAQGVPIGGVHAEAPDGVVVSERVLRSWFDGERNVIGRVITVDGQRRVVVGIMPSTFRFPSPNTVMWTTSGPGQSLAIAGVYVRLASAVSRVAAVRELAKLAESAGVNPRFVVAEPLVGALDASYTQGIRFLCIGTGLLFVVLCANVSGLWLMSVGGRRRELAVLTALGATRTQIVRRLSIEMATRAAAGTVFGVGVAWMLVQFANTYLPPSLVAKSLHSFTVDARTVAFAVCAGVVAAILVGWLPAVVGGRSDAAQLVGLRDYAGGEPRSARLAARVLVIAQLGFSFALILAALVLVHSFVRLVQTERGVDASRVVIADVELDDKIFAQTAGRRAAFDRVERAAGSLTGVIRTAWSYGLPPEGGGTFDGSWTADSSTIAVHMQAYQYPVGEDFFDFYGIPLLAGRSLTKNDDRSAAIVSERLASALWPHSSPVGHLVSVRQGSMTLHYVVIGLVRELRFPSVDPTRDAPQLYVRFDPRSTLRGMLMLKTSGAGLGLSYIWQRLAEAAPPGVHILGVRALEETYTAEFRQPRAAASLALVFALVAVMAGATGMFCLLAVNLKRRMREFGIMCALGASPAHLRWLVWREAALLLTAGLLVGAAGASGLLRGLQPLLFEITTTDRASWLLAMAAMIIGCATAACRPLLAAGRVSPANLMRSE